MMHIRSFDAETIPAEDIPEECLPVFDPDEVNIPSNWGQEAAQRKIEKERAGFDEKRKKALGVKPEFCRPCSFIGYDSKTDEQVEFFAKDAAEERILVSNAWDWIREAQSTGITLVSYNGKTFDMQVLHRRAMMLDIKAVTSSAYHKLIDTRLENKVHIDLELSLGLKTPFSNKPIIKSLEYWCAYFGIGAKPTGWSGASVYPAFLAGRYDEILTYNEIDVRLTTNLFQRVEPWITD